MTASTTATFVNAMSIPSAVERSAEQPEPPECRQQADARDRRREHERKLDQRDEQRLASKAPSREEVRRRRAEEDDQRHRDEVRLGGDAERIERDLAREPVAQLAGRQLREDRDDREQQERQRCSRRDREQRGEGREPHGSPKRAARSCRRPSGPRTEITKSWAASMSTGFAAIASS